MALTPEQEQADRTIYDKHVRKDLLDAANTAHRDAQARLAAAEQALKEATAKHAGAEKAAEEAAAGKGSTLPLDAEAVLVSAELEVRSARRVRDAAQRAITEAETQIKVATYTAHIPVYQAGMRLRFAALLKAERAKALLAEAQADYDQSARVMNHVARTGGVRVFNDDAHWLGRPMRSVAEEAPYWRQHNEWWDGNVEALVAEISK